MQDPKDEPELASTEAGGSLGQEFNLPIDEHEEVVSEGGRQVRLRGVYLLPNLLTLGALFAGFYAIIAECLVILMRRVGR